jgi:putative two-component system response regulator
MRKVVLVDDDPINVSVLKTLMADFPDCETLGFSVAYDALTWCYENEPDLVVVDYLMAKLDGISFAEKLREIPSRADVPLIMVTADRRKEVRYRALEAGVQDFLDKPIDKVEFRARAGNLLKLRTTQKQLAIRNLVLEERIRRATDGILDRERAVVLRLARAAEYRDPQSPAHLERMARYCRLLAFVAGLSDRDQADLYTAAPMHDIGNVGIPDSILLKPGPLTLEERSIMQEHTVIGHDILQGSGSRLIEMAASIALNHHERYDGTGYPRRLKGRDIPLVGRICAIADAFDGMTSSRPYKAALSDGDALGELYRLSGYQLDPQLVPLFLGAKAEAFKIRDQFRDPEPATAV